MRGRIPVPVGDDVLMTGRVRGIRSWHLVPGPAGEWRLGGLNGTPWERGGPTRARCTAGGHREHAPAEGCTCGLHAVHPFAHEWVAWTSRYALTVCGLVRAWGCVHLHREGFRAQWAEPAALCLIGSPRGSEHGRLVAAVAEAHGAELWEVAHPDEITRRCVAEGIGLAKRTVDALVGPDVSDPDRFG